MNLNAGVLRRIARLAHDRINARIGDREPHVDMDAIVAVVFAAASLEAFINETAALAGSSLPSDPPSVRAFADCVREIEANRGATEDKYEAAGWAFVGRPYDWGVEPFQSCEVLFRLRNAVVHLKAEDLRTWS